MIIITITVVVGPTAIQVGIKMIEQPLANFCPQRSGSLCRQSDSRSTPATSLSASPIFVDPGHLLSTYDHILYLFHILFGEIHTLA